VYGALCVLGERELFARGHNGFIFDEHGVAEARHELEIEIETVAYSEARARRKGQAQKSIVAPSRHVGKCHSSQRTRERSDEARLGADSQLALFERYQWRRAEQIDCKKQAESAAPEEEANASIREQPRIVELRTAQPQAQFVGESSDEDPIG
jgi:hypothetical protein